MGKKISELDEKILLVILVGIFEALKNNSLLIDEAEKCLLSPYMVNKLKKARCNAHIINIIERGCELEDIESLLPKELYSNIDELLQESLVLLSQYRKFNNEYWIDG